MTDRRGFTLVELLIVVVLGGLVLASVFQVLVSNQRIYTAQSASVLGQQTVRGGIELLSTEIRELSPRGGDLIDMAADRLEIRVMRGVAVVCGIDNTNPLRVRASIMGTPIQTGDSVFVFADAGTGDPEDDFWARGEVTSTPATGTPGECGGEPSRRLEISNLDPQPTADQVGSGTLVRSFEIAAYGPVTLDGETFLGRSIGGGGGEPLIGPISPDDGVRFEYFDGDGTATTVGTDVRAVRVTVRTTSGARDARGRPIEDSLSVFVNPRN